MDSLTATETLIDSGVPETQAKATTKVATAIAAQVIDDKQVATKDDIRALRDEIRALEIRMLIYMFSFHVTSIGLMVFIFRQFQ